MTRRWFQLFFGLVAIVAISGPQYTSAVFTTLREELGVGLAWMADSLAMLLLTFCAVGGGIIYGGVIGLVVRSFPDGRGFVTTRYEQGALV